MYCEKCSRIFDGYSALCPACGSRKVREPRMDDACFLVEKEAIWGEMLADVLTQNGIVFLKRPVLGAGIALKLGQRMERYRFYVPYSRREEAQEILDSLFPPAEE